MRLHSVLVVASAAALSCAACGDSEGGSGSDDGSGGAGATSSSTAPGSGGPAPSAATGSPGEVLGEPHTGDYHLGPVEWEGSFWNACAPYPGEVQTLEGEMLAGVSNELGADGSLCDACIQVDTDAGKSVIARVVTYGVTQAPGNIDVSQAAFDVLNVGENPRSMTWKLVSCAGTEPLRYQFQEGANPYWTSLWVRNPRVAIAKVAVTSANHAQPFELTRGPDGTFTDAGGFGEGAFTLTITGVDGATAEEHFDGFTPGALVTGATNL